MGAVLSLLPQSTNKQHQGLTGLDYIATIVPLYYKSIKYIKVDVPIVAIIHKTCQLLAVLLSLVQLYFNDGWAMTEEPGGMANAWGEAGNMLVATNDTTLSARTQYCSNASYTYVEGSYTMAAPACRSLLPVDLVAKTVESIFFTTSFLETTVIGWPCADASDDAGDYSSGDFNTGQSAWVSDDAAAIAIAEESAAACLAGNGTLFTRRNGQCGCETVRSVYALAVDQLTMSLEHAYDTSESFGDWQGSSAEDGQGLKTNLDFGNGTIRKFDAGEVLTLPLHEWLHAAHVDLDSSNRAVRRDDEGRLPPMRTTGVNVRVDIEYSNINKGTQRAVIGKREVHADVSLRTEYGTWTGLGSQAIWVVYPSNPDGTVPQRYHLIERQRQGVLFQFHTSGMIFKFDIFYVLGVLTAALVMIKFADVVADAVAFYMLPNGQSTVLRNKRQELVSKRSEFAEIGMKAALLAATYRSFDPDNNGTIEAVDIVRVFAHVEGVSWEQAHAIAHMIMADADTSDEGEVAGGPGGLSYIEYMTCVEGDSIDFADFLKNIEPVKDTVDAEECRLAFEEERKSLPPKEGRPLEDMDPPAPPIPGPSLGLSDEQKEARLGRRGVLRVHFASANGLKTADADGLSDPYAMAQIGKKLQVKSKTIAKTLSPAWDETLPFKVTPELQTVVDADLIICVMDKDPGILDKDDEVGKCSVALSALAECDSVTFAEALEPQGTVHFTVSWADGKDCPVKKKKKPKTDTEANGEAPTAAAGEEPPSDSASLSPTKKKKKPKTDAEPDGSTALPEPAALPPPAEGEAAAASPSPKKKKKKKAESEGEATEPETMQIT